MNEQAASAIEKNKGGRPTIYAEHVADAVLQRHASGESLIAIGKETGMPSRRTIDRWKREDREGFGQRLARARKMYAETLMYRAGDELDITDAELVELKSAASAAVQARRYRSEWARGMAVALDRDTWGDTAINGLEQLAKVVVFAGLASARHERDVSKPAQVEAPKPFKMLSQGKSKPRDAVKLERVADAGDGSHPA